MRKTIWTMLACLASTYVSAQEVPKADLFLGYSFLRVNSAREIPAFTANGGAGTFAYNFNNHIGIEAEFGGYHNGNVHDIQFDSTFMTYTFGPRISYGRTRRIDPYFHILFGGIHATSSILAPGATVPPTRLATSQDAFAMPVGGGLDVRLNKRITLRPIQLDYLLTRIQDLGLTGVSQNRNQNNLRYAAGLGFNF